MRPDMVPGGAEAPPGQTNCWKGPDEDLRHRVGPAPDRLAERCLAEIHQVVQRPTSGQPPPGSLRFDSSVGPPPFSGANRLYGWTRTARTFPGLSLVTRLR